MLADLILTISNQIAKFKSLPNFPAIRYFSLASNPGRRTIRSGNTCWSQPWESGYLRKLSLHNSSAHVQYSRNHIVLFMCNLSKLVSEQFSFELSDRVLQFFVMAI